MTRFLPIERSVLHSPAWFVPYDEFARRVTSAGVTVALDRLDGQVWEPTDVAPVRTPSAAIAFPGLGRRLPAATRFRARFQAPGFQALYPAEGEPFTSDAVGVEFLTHPYDETSPPEAPATPRLVRLLPAASFAHPPGVRVVYGAVLDGDSGAAVPNALVSAEGTAGQDAVPWRERTLTDERGGFRLALRWPGALAGGEELFTLLAVERPGRSGSLAVRLPADAGRRHVIEIVP